VIVMHHRVDERRRGHQRVFQRGIVGGVEPQKLAIPLKRLRL